MKNIRSQRDGGKTHSPPSKAEIRFYWLWAQSVDEKLRIAGASRAMTTDSLFPDGGGGGSAENNLSKQEVGLWLS